jgi:hypothetical protein
MTYNYYITETITTSSVKSTITIYHSIYPVEPHNTQKKKKIYAK